jgi:hypothetical protein
VVTLIQNSNRKSFKLCSNNVQTSENSFLNEFDLKNVKIQQNKAFEEKFIK